MHFLTYKFVPRQLWEKKDHHHLYNTSLQAHEEANTRIQVFYTVIPERVNKSNKPRVDTLACVLQKYHNTLQRNSAAAREPSIRAKIGDKDFRRILRYEEDVKKWLENTIKLQSKLQNQIDAEAYFEKQEQDRKLQTIIEEKERHSEYLKNKPLPPLRKSIVSFTSGLKSRVTILPAEKDVEVWLMLEDEELNPILEAYCPPGMAFQRDGFVKSPTNNKQWI